MIDDQSAPPARAIPDQLVVDEAAAFGHEPTTGIPGRERSEIVRRVLVYASLIAVALLFLVPFAWSVSTSFKTLPESQYFDLIPNEPTLRAYRRALTSFNFDRYFVNSLFLSTVVTMFNLALASLGGYAFARLRFPGREVLFLLVLGTMMIPDQLRLVPIFQMLIDIPLSNRLTGEEFGWNWIGTYQGYFAINLIGAANLFLMRQYFLTIPKDYEEAAKLDGAGYFKTYLRVMLPLTGPALAAVAILTFQGTWNDFFWPLIVFLGNSDLYPLTVGIFQFKDEYETQWPELMAGSVISILPIALLYVFFQRYFVAGVAAAGVKG
jgi:multiple sugar transport system permease protein